MKEIVKADFIKIKTFCSVKDSVKRIRNTNYTLQENICKCMSDKEILLKYKRNPKAQ